MPEQIADNAVLARIHRNVLDWYERHQRDLPWRRTSDPYAILVSEVMLQQTQVDRVIPKYHEFLEAFPTIEALAAASRAEVITRWAPLGYNLRAVRLHEIARQVVEQHGGRLPSTVEGLLSLKGLGPYTAGAVACFGFRQRVPILDTNVRRVLGRIFDGVDLDRSPASERRGWVLAEAALPDGDCYDWNQALMDLGATICKARRPACLLCPVRSECRYASWAGDASDAADDRMTSTVGSSYRVAAAPHQAVAERSTTYRTAPFIGSRRYYRGRVVDALRALPAGSAIAASELGPIVKADFESSELVWLEGLLEGLERDGLVALDRTEGGLRVRLPA